MNVLVFALAIGAGLAAASAAMSLSSTNPRRVCTGADATPIIYLSAFDHRLLMDLMRTRDDARN
jgi:hypothetical protein